MTERRNFDTLTPEFRLAVNGSDLPLAARADVTAVSVLEDVNATSMFTFSLQCWDTAEMKVKWIDDDLFTEGNSVTIEMGYRDEMEKIFDGEITGLEPEFSEDGLATLTVRGYDRRHRMMGKRKARSFLAMKDSDIASQIAGDWGLSPEVTNSEVTLDYVLQHNQTDFDFLRERAARIGYEVVVTEKTLAFRPRKTDGSAAVTLNREVELLDFSARMSAVGQVEEIRVQGWDPKAKEEFSATASAGSEGPMGGSSSGPDAARQHFTGTGSTRVDWPLQSQAEAESMAGGILKEIAMQYVTADGVCIGRPDLRAGTLVSIEGLGRRFSGPYYVTSAEHRFCPKSGYRTSFTVRRNAT